MTDIKFETIKAYNNIWIKNITKENGAMHHTIDNKKIDTNIVISAMNQKFGRLYCDITDEQLKILVNSYDVFICEIIHTYPFKIYFDIDKKHSDSLIFNDYIEMLKIKIDSIFPDSDMGISGSFTNSKASLHIILNNYMIQNIEQHEFLKILVRYLYESFDNGFDANIYKRNQQMKTINQSKPLTKESPIKRIQKVITNENEEKHFITCYFNCTYNTINNIIIDDELKEELTFIKNKKPIDVSKLPKIITNLEQTKLIKNDIINNIEFSPTYLLNITPINEQFDHSYTFGVMLFCYKHNVSLENFLNWYSKKTNDINRINNKRNIWQTLDKYEKYLNIDAYKNLLAVYYPALRTNKGTVQFNILSDISNHNANINYIDTISPEHFLTKTKYINFFIGMGSGKTEQTIRYLKLNSSKKFLFISPNQALCIGVYNRLKDAILQLNTMILII